MIDPYDWIHPPKTWYINCIKKLPRLLIQVLLLIILEEAWEEERQKGTGENQAQGSSYSKMWYKYSIGELCGIHYFSLSKYRILRALKYHEAYPFFL